MVSWKIEEFGIFLSNQSPGITIAWEWTKIDARREEEGPKANNSCCLAVFSLTSPLSQEKYTQKVVKLPSKHSPLKNTRCSKRKRFISSSELKLISLATLLHFRIFFGTLASCSASDELLKEDEYDREIFRSGYLTTSYQTCGLWSLDQGE